MTVASTPSPSSSDGNTDDHRYLYHPEPPLFFKYELNWYEAELIKSRRALSELERSKATDREILTVAVNVDELAMLREIRRVRRSDNLTAGTRVAFDARKYDNAGILMEQHRLLWCETSDKILQLERALRESKRDLREAKQHIKALLATEGSV